MTIDIDLQMVDGNVYISVGSDWTLMRKSDEIGEIFCESEYLFIEDHIAENYQAFAPLAGERGVRSEGDTVEDARENLEAAIDEYYYGDGEIQYDIEGSLAFDSAE